MTDRMGVEINGGVKVNSTLLEKSLSHPGFIVGIAVVIGLNAILLGIQINHEAVDGSRVMVFEFAEYFCLFVFTVELLLRILAMKSQFCARHDRYWNCFDTFLVSTSWVELILSFAARTQGTNPTSSLPGPGGALGKLVKMARLARIMRIIRMLRFFNKIRIMVAMIVGSMASLFWLLALLFSLMYFFAIVLTQGATDIVNPPPGMESFVDPETTTLVQHFFGSLISTIYTLFMTLCSGVSWEAPARATQAMGRPYFECFLFYVFFTFFSVLNIVTGVFVDGAIQRGNSDRATMIEHTMMVQRKYASSLRQLLEEIDQDGSGVISHQEWVEAQKNENLIACMSALGVGGSSVDVLWEILDSDGDGCVDIHEFVNGMMHLKGGATAIDMHQCLRLLRALVDDTRALVETKQRRKRVRRTLEGQRPGFTLDAPQPPC